MVHLRFQASTRPGIADAYRRMFPEPRHDGIDALALREDQLTRIPHRTLLLHGRDDQVIPATPESVT